MTVGIARLRLGPEWLAFRPSANVELADQPGVLSCRTFRVRWRR
jgi:hypothetical protein